MKTEDEREFPEFSLMEGGPGDALMKRLRLIRPELGAASGRTAIILAILTWLPLLAFSPIEGLALGGVRIPFLYDIAAHARFLVAVSSKFALLRARLIPPATAAPRPSSACCQREGQG